MLGAYNNPVENHPVPERIVKQMSTTMWQRSVTQSCCYYTDTVTFPNTDTGSTNTCPNTSSYPWTNFNSITFIRIITRNSPTLPQNKYKTNNTYNLQHKNNVLNICTCPRHPGFVACWQLTTFVYNTLKRTTITNDFYSPTLQCPSTYPRRPLSTWLSSFTVQDPEGWVRLRDLKGAVSFSRRQILTILGQTAWVPL